MDKKELDMDELRLRFMKGEESVNSVRDKLGYKPMVIKDETGATRAYIRSLEKKFEKLKGYVVDKEQEKNPCYLGIIRVTESLLRSQMGLFARFNPVSIEIEEIYGGDDVIYRMLGYSDLFEPVEVGMPYPHYTMEFVREEVGGKVSLEVIAEKIES